jgi:hypothetical protein
MPLKEMAASTSAWLLTRSLGGTLGIAVFQAFITTGLESRFPKLDGYGSDFGIPRDLDGYHRLHSLPDGPEKQAALFAFSDSLRVSLSVIEQWCDLASDLIWFELSCYGSSGPL